MIRMLFALAPCVTIKINIVIYGDFFYYGYSKEKRIVS